jgi:hypothetical protein
MKKGWQSLTPIGDNMSRRDSSRETHPESRDLCAAPALWAVRPKDPTPSCSTRLRGEVSLSLTLRETDFGGLRLRSDPCFWSRRVRYEVFSSDWKPHTRSGGVPDRIRNGASSAGYADFANPLDAEGIHIGIVLVNEKRFNGRHVSVHRNVVFGQIGVHRTTGTSIDDSLFVQREWYAPDHTAIILGANKTRIDHASGGKGADDARAAGEIRADITPEDLLRALVGMCYSYDQPGWQSTVLRLVDVFVDGLGVKARAKVW